MTAYLVNHQKKINIFKQKEKELMHALKNDYSSEKIEKAVEKLRAAKLSVYKAKYAKKSVLPPSSYKPEGEALEWLNYSTDEILNKYV